MLQILQHWLNGRRATADRADRIAADLIAAHGANGVRIALRVQRESGAIWMDGGSLERAVYRALMRQGAVMGKADTATRMLYRMD